MDAGAGDSDRDHNEIMDMLQILTNHFLSVLWAGIADDKVASSSNTDLVGHLGRKD